MRKILIIKYFINLFFLCYCNIALLYPAASKVQHTTENTHEDLGKWFGKKHFQIVPLNSNIKQDEFTTSVGERNFLLGNLPEYGLTFYVNNMYPDLNSFPNKKQLVDVLFSTRLLTTQLEVDAIKAIDLTNTKDAEAVQNAVVNLTKYLKATLKYVAFFKNQDPNIKNPTIEKAIKAIESLLTEIDNDKKPNKIIVFNSVTRQMQNGNLMSPVWDLVHTEYLYMFDLLYPLAVAPAAAAAASPEPDSALTLTGGIQVEEPIIFVSKYDMCYQCETLCTRIVRENMQNCREVSNYQIGNITFSPFKMLVGSFFLYTNSRERFGNMQHLLKVALNPQNRVGPSQSPIGLKPGTTVTNIQQQPLSPDITCLQFLNGLFQRDGGDVLRVALPPPAAPPSALPGSGPGPAAAAVAGAGQGPRDLGQRIGGVQQPPSVAYGPGIGLGLGQGPGAVTTGQKPPPPPPPPAPLPSRSGQMPGVDGNVRGRLVNTSVKPTPSPLHKTVGAGRTTTPSSTQSGGGVQGILRLAAFLKKNVQTTAAAPLPGPGAGAGAGTGAEPGGAGAEPRSGFVLGLGQGTGAGIGSGAQKKGRSESMGSSGSGPGAGEGDQSFGSNSSESNESSSHSDSTTRSGNSNRKNKEEHQHNRRRTDSPPNGVEPAAAGALTEADVIGNGGSRPGPGAEAAENGDGRQGLAGSLDPTLLPTLPPPSPPGSEVGTVGAAGDCVHNYVFGAAARRICSKCRQFEPQN